MIEPDQSRSPTNSEEVAAPQPPITREHRFDVLRNSADLYGSIYHVISELAAYHIKDDLAGIGYFAGRHLAEIAAKVLPHLPEPAEQANVWDPP
jgi:ATP-dependent helicase YprA (DUF1998 family)